VKADDKSKVYGQTDPAFTVSYTGFVNGDTESVLGGTLSFSRAPGEAVGSYLITPSGLTSTNYAISFATGNLTISKAALTVTAADATRVYGDANPVLTGTLTGVQAGDNITASYASSADASSPVGNHAIVPTLHDPNGKLGNYNVTINNGTLSITKASLTVNIDNKSRLYGAADPTFTGSVVGIRNGDNITATYVPGATISSPVGAYAITATLGDPDTKLGNYNVTVNNGILTIAPAPLNVTTDDKSRRYGGANPAFTGTITGIQNGDNLTLSFSTAATASSPVGTYAIVASVNDPGNKLGNYTVTAANGTLTISPAGVTGITIVANHAHIVGSADGGTVFKIEASTNLSTWTEVGTVTVAADGSFELIDPDLATLETRFYRAIAP
jgi:hypothetical protein